MHSEKSEFGTFSVAAEAAAAVHTRWASGSPPSIAEVLSPQVLSDDDCLAETLAADAEERRRRTLPGRLEEYLAVAPQIRERPGVCRAVLMVEVVARAAESEEALRTDLMARFPSLAAEVDAVVGLASLFRSAAEDARPATGAHVPGETIGKYRIHRWLGEGAFGEVWQAWDVDLERYVALKILRATHHSGIRGQRIFLAETRAAAALDHESVVRIHAAGRFAETGEYYIDAQLVGEAAPTPDDPRGMQPGRTLEQRLRTGPIPPREAAALLAAAARGVAAAHARGITHRDIKPSNILVSGAGRPLVSDFGLSLSDSGAAARPMPEPAARPGAPGGFARLAGTPAYMAPEQAGGLIATPLSDVFSLGATLRALLSGRPPYLPDPDRAEGSREQVIAMARLGKLSPLQSICPGVPRTLAAICDRATSRSPGDRYPSAERLAADLEAFLGQRPTLADPPSTVRAAWMWCRRHSMTSLVGLAAGVLVIGATTAFVVRLTVERDRAVAAEIESQKQRDAAVDARQTVETINAFFARTFSSARGLEESDDIGVIDAIRLASGRAGRMFGDRPIVEAGVRHFLGQSAMGAKSLETAEQELRRAWDLRRALLGVHAPDTLATRRQMADLLMLQRKFGEAETVFREILGPLQQSVGEDSPDALRALAFLGNQERVRGNPGAARDMLERATAGYRRITQHGAADRQQALNWLVLAYVELKRLDLAERAQREIVAMNEADLGPDDVSTLNAAQALGWVLRLEKKDDEAEAIFRATLARYSEIVSPNHLGMLHVAVELAGTIISRSPAEAADLARRVIAGAETHAEGNLTQLRGLVTLGRALVLQNLDQEAEPVLRRSLDLGVKHRGADHQLTRDSARLLIGVLERQSRSADADEVRRRVPLEATPER